MDERPATPPVPAMVPVGPGVVLRPWRGMDEIPAMAAANRRLRAHVGRLEPVEDAVLAHAYATLVRSDPARDLRIVDVAGSVAGYVRAEWRDLVAGERAYDLTVVVEPAAWGRGIADAALAWGIGRCGALAAENPSDRPAVLTSWAFGGDAELVPALEARGYEAWRHDAEMLRPDLAAIETHDPAPGYTLRIPDEAELPAVFAMFVEAFREHWGEAEGEEDRFDAWRGDPRFRRDLLVVAWAPDGSPVACVQNMLEPRPDGTVIGLLDSVATHPGHRRRGLARAAIAESLRRLRDAGAGAAYLGVDLGNHNEAAALYEACGFRLAARSAEYRRSAEGAW